MGHPRSDDNERAGAALDHARGESSGEDVRGTDVDGQGGFQVVVREGHGVHAGGEIFCEGPKDGWHQALVVRRGHVSNPRATCLVSHGPNVVRGPADRKGHGQVVSR